MATSINPYLLFIAISPGAGNDLDRTYPPPTAGLPPHPGWCPPDAFWKKLRRLAVRILQGVKPDLKEDECLALSGLLNLGTRNEAHPNEVFVAGEEKYIKWIPTAVQMLNPKIVVTLGLKRICGYTVVQNNWRNSVLDKLLVKTESPPIPFKWNHTRPLTTKFWC